MTPALRLVTAAEAAPRIEQLILRPVVIFVREGMRMPVAVLNGCRRRGAARAESPTVRPRPLCVVGIGIAAPVAAWDACRSRPRTIRPRALSPEAKRRLLADEAELRSLGVFDDRPQTYGDCQEEGPCPWVSCRHHLYLEVNRENGAIKLNFPNVPVWEMEDTCSLAVAARGKHSCGTVGRFINVTEERVVQIRKRTLPKMRAAARRLVGDAAQDAEAEEQLKT